MAVCLTVNEAGGYVGSFVVCGVTVILAVTPTDGTPSGFVLTYTDTSTGITRSVRADSSSTCSSLTFINVVLSCGTFNVTVNNDSSCCGSSSASTSAGGGSSLIVTSCCPNGIPSRLYAVPFAYGGTCDQTLLYGVTVPLDYDPTLPSHTWKGTYYYAVPGGYYSTFKLRCNPANNIWYLEIVRTGNAIIACASSNVEAISIRCDPFTLAFRMGFSVNNGECCTGQIYYQIVP